jgi:signal transduction histidine kinase/CheY-like chemotaxis protein
VPYSRPAAPPTPGQRLLARLAALRLLLPRPVWSAAGLAAALAVVAAVSLWQLRRDALDGQARELSLLSLALSDNVDRGLQGTEVGLRALRAELASGMLSCGGAVAREALRSRASLMPQARALWLIDEQGRLLCASDDFEPPEPALFLPAPHDLPDDALAISRSFASPLTGEALVALAVAYAAGPQAPRGWLITALPARSLLGAFAVANAVPDARLAIFRRDGARLAGSIVAAPTLDEARLAEILARQSAMEQRRFRDGTERLVSQRTLERYGLHVMVTRNVEVALAPWREAASLTAISVAFILLIGLAAARWVNRADTRHRAAEQALQTQLSRAGKLEALGSLAGGVAHDFNNVLAAIVGYGEMAQDDAAPGSDLARHLDRMLQAALRGKQLVERILAFSRGGARASTEFELEPIVDEVLDLLAASLQPGVVIERDLQAPGACLRGDPTQAFEAIMNLCTNAMQAMQAPEANGVTPVGTDGAPPAPPPAPQAHGESRLLSVQMRWVQVDTERVLSHSRLAPGRYLALSVSDQGPGISAAVMERLFEPFFTTRASQHGTGLGLAVVHGVVTEFGGAIDVSNLQPRGARFTLYLPELGPSTRAPAPSGPPASLPGTTQAPAAEQALPGQPGELTAAASPAVASPGAHAALPPEAPELLVVDDEPALSALTGELLAGLGYRSHCHDDPAEALAALRAAPSRYAALLTDEVMPGLIGTRLTREAHAIAPDLPVLLISAYGGPALAARARAAGVRCVLAKPLQRAELARALHELLGQ